MVTAASLVAWLIITYSAVFPGAIADVMQSRAQVFYGLDRELFFSFSFLSLPTLSSRARRSFLLLLVLFG